MQHRAVARGALWNTIGYVVGGLLSVAMPVLLLKWLGRASYGVVTYITLLTSQAYLLNLGMGEVVAQRLTAAVSLGRLAEGWRRIRAGLTVVWSVTILLSGLWIGAGPSFFARLLSLRAEEHALLENVRAWVPWAIWGVQTGMFLGWIPIALHRFRWAALNTTLQAVCQAVLPLGVLFMAGEKTPLLALKAILAGHSLYGLSVWVLTSYVIGRLLLPGKAPEGFLSLLRASIWPATANLTGILLNFTERTLIARWVSLSLMGFYSALHYLFGKAASLLYKAVEALFPVFGSQATSVRRQGLRLSQTVWLLGVLNTTATLVAWIGLCWGLPHLPVRIGPVEYRMIAGVIGSWIAMVPTLPLATFLQSRGAFRAAFGYSAVVTGIQVGASLLLVREGLLFWATIVGSWAGIGFGTILLNRRYGLRSFWYAWAFSAYWKAMVVTGIAMGWYFSALPPVMQMGGLTFCAGVFVLWEFGGKAGARKRLFLRQMALTLSGLVGGAWRRFLCPLWQRSLNNG